MDRGELSEGSLEYLIAQKVVREGFGSLAPEEQATFRKHLEARLGARTETDSEPTRSEHPPGDTGSPPPFPPAELMSKRAG